MKNDKTQNILDNSTNSGIISQTIEEIVNGKYVNKISDMIKYNDKIIVGLSGGADSIALTHFLCTIAPYYNLQIIACHINHGIRGNEADNDQKFVRNFCKKLYIPLEELKVDLIKFAANKKESLEECGRNVRYDFFKECCKVYNAKIATAHTLSDSIETILLNLIRGTGLKGLCGVPAVRDNIIRPFIVFTRSDVEQYCKENKLSFVVDSTNLSHDYSRNLIRHKIIPVISSINSNYPSTISRCCDIILEDEIYLSSLAADFLYNIRSYNGYYIKELHTLPNNIKNRVLILILKENDLPYSYKKVKLLSDFIDGNLLGSDRNQSKLILNNKKFCQKYSYYLKICDINHKIAFNKVKINFKIKEYCLDSNKYIKFDIIKYGDIHYKIIKDKSILKYCIDFDKINGKTLLRYRKNGDAIKLAYRGVSKSLKKLFNESKVSIVERNKTFVMEDEDGIIWVENFGADERVNVNSKTKCVLFIKIEKK